MTRRRSRSKSPLPLLLVALLLSLVFLVVLPPRRAAHLIEALKPKLRCYRGRTLVASQV
jgi:hypothetical protein